MGSTKKLPLSQKPKIQPIADMGILVRFENEKECQAFSRTIQLSQKPWIFDVVPAYNTIAIYHNPALIQLKGVIAEIKNLIKTQDEFIHQNASKTLEVPCCYEFGPDLEIVAELKGLTTKEVIKLHSETEYCVYAIGFSPGFPYMGYLPKKLEGVPRLPSPRLKVPAGSVGLTGIQTGIYPEQKPGG